MNSVLKHKKKLFGFNGISFRRGIFPGNPPGLIACRRDAEEDDGRWNPVLNKYFVLIEIKRINVINIIIVGNSEKQVPGK